MYSLIVDTNFRIGVKDSMLGLLGCTSTMVVNLLTAAANSWQMMYIGE